MFFQKIFDAIGFLQLVVYHPLLSISFPGNVVVVNNHLIDIATYDVLPTDDIFPAMFNLDTDGMEPLNERYNEFRFETQNILLNLGSLFIMFLGILLKLLIIFITSLPKIRDFSCAKKVKAFTAGNLLWSGILEYLFSAYSEIVFGVFLHSAEFTWKGSGSTVFPNLMYFCFATAAVLLPIWTIYFLQSRYKQLDEDYY